mgnify:CR=1 FL=1
MVCVITGDPHMLVNRKELKKTIIQETTLTLINNGLLNEAKNYYLEKIIKLLHQK